MYWPGKRHVLRHHDMLFITDCNERVEYVFRFRASSTGITGMIFNSRASAIRVFRKVRLVALSGVGAQVLDDVMTGLLFLYLDTFIHAHKKDIFMRMF